ncbi:MAG: nucleotidyltransferase family protein [Nitrospinae bacterium]|nr:nucleotidyltransferase family protein [Nitrospinota bacterium]
MSAIITLRKNREAILHLASKHGARDVRVFGSVARGEDRPDSDVDFIVEMEAGRSLFDRAGLIVDLEALLGRHVDVVTERAMKDHIKKRALAEAVRL